MNLKNSNLPQLILELAVVGLCGESKNNFEEHNKNNDKIVKIQEENKEVKSEIKEVKKLDSKKEEIKNISDESIKSSSIKAVDSISLKSMWPKVLNEISPHNRSLYFILKESQPVKIEDGKLILGIKFKIYAERINQKKNYALIGEIIDKVYGSKYPLDYVVDNSISSVEFVPDEKIKEAPKNESSNILNDAMEVFG